MMGLSSGDDLCVHLHADGYAADLSCNGEPNSNSIDVANHYYVDTLATVSGDHQTKLTEYRAAMAIQDFMRNSAEKSRQHYWRLTSMNTQNGSCASLSYVL